MYDLTLIEIQRLLEVAYYEQLAEAGMTQKDLQVMERFARDHGLRIR